MGLRDIFARSVVLKRRQDRLRGGKSDLTKAKVSAPSRATPGLDRLVLIGTHKNCVTDHRRAAPSVRFMIKTDQQRFANANAHFT
jgi:hypothetical protein